MEEKNKNVTNNLFTFTRSKTSTDIKIQKRTSSTKDAFKQLFKNKISIFGLIVLLILIVTGIVVYFISPYDPINGDSTQILLPPSSTHWFGTDQLGRDLWTRTWVGLLVSLLIATIASTFNMIIAIAVGISSGYFEKADKFFTPIIKILYALPSILILILFSTIFGPSFWVIILSLMVTGWVGPSQQIRAHTLRMRNLEFISASQTLGTSATKILGTFFILAIPTIFISTSMLFPRMILAEATLGFLGLSMPDIPTLGSLINSGRNYILQYPSKVFIPIGYLVGVVASIQFLSFGIESAFGSSRTGN